MIRAEGNKIHGEISASRPDRQAQIFQTGDGWFPYNFATKLAQIG